MTYKISFILLIPILISLAPARSYGDVKIIAATFDRGVRECRDGKYAKGIDTIIDAAMELRREAPRHRLNSQWRSKLRFCFTKWSSVEERSCKRNHRVEAYHNLLKIEAKAAVIAGKGLRQTLGRTRASCFGSLKGHLNRTCKKDPAAIDALAKLSGYVAKQPRLHGQLRGILGKCLKNQWNSTLALCRTSFSMATLRQVFNMYKLMPRTKVATQEYQSCLDAQMQGARLLCRAMKFRQGKKLFDKAHYLLKHARPGNELLLSKAAEASGECGLFRLDFSVTMRAVSGKIPFVLPATSRLIATRTPDGKSIRACGVLSFGRVPVKRKGCTSQATVPETKPHYICLKGRLARQPGKRHQIAHLSFDGTMARTLVRESIQSVCARRSPVVFTERLFEQLLVPRTLRVTIPVQGGEKKMFRHAFDAGGGRKSVFQGSFSIHML